MVVVVQQHKLEAQFEFVLYPQNEKSRPETNQGIERDFLTYFKAYYSPRVISEKNDTR